jgi:hypothetical protein
LLLLNKLTLKELSELRLNFIKNKSKVVESEAAIFNLFNLSKKYKLAKEEQLLKQKYIERYPNGKFLTQIKQ